MDGEEFKCKNGQRVRIEIDENDDYKARVRALVDKEIGRLEFREMTNVERMLRSEHRSFACPRYRMPVAS